MHFGGSAKRGRKKNMNFELNLVPFIDVLSTCICFLLVTAVFINLGSMQVSQAVGSAKQKQEEKPKGSVTASFGGGGEIRFQVKDVPGMKGGSTVTINGVGGKLDFDRTEQWIQSFAGQYADVKTVLIMPNPYSKYDDLIQLMAQFKKSRMDEIGIAPL
ncbi:MAG TPA: biopolymer transporter ExbD [Bdellovibrionales bacterium]|nr:biopolymer transporter ExbD [Bdellovibrionales bacterium]